MDEFGYNNTKCIADLFFYLFLWQDIACVENKTIVLNGPEKAVKSIFRYLEPLENQYSFKGVEYGEDADKSIKILNLIIRGPTYKTLTSGDKTWQRFDILFQSFSKFCQSLNLNCIVNALKLQKERTTLLICIPSNISFTPDNVKWMCASVNTNKKYDDIRFVVTECSCKSNCKCFCKCKSFSVNDIPNEIQCYITGPPIFQRTNLRRIGSPLFMLKYNGDFSYENVVAYLIFTFCNTVQGYGHKGLRELFKRKNQISKWRCFNCAQLPPIKNAPMNK